MLRGRKSASALADGARERGSDIAEGFGSAAGEVGSKAAETVSDLAEKATGLAREAQKAATPVIRSAMVTAAGRARSAQKTATPVVRSAAATAAEALSDAAEHAAEVLSETAGRLAQPAEELQLSARERLADASEQLARSIRPRRRRRLRAVLIGTGIVGVAAGVMISPLGARLRSLVGLGGAGPEPAPMTAGIVLPGDPAPTPENAGESIETGEPGANGDRVLSAGRTARTTAKSE
jgi:vacuolar-type H+-ATPase subunit H